MALAYEWTHYLTHTSYVPRGRYYARICRAHRLHHFKDEGFWYGFTLPFVDALLRTLFPKALLITPNLHEAAALTGQPVETEEQMVTAARLLLQFGPKAVLVKGGHLNGQASDVLVTKETLDWFTAARIDTPHTHGTGCTYSAAITALLATGTPLREAIAKAKSFITEAIQSNPGLGKGHGPVNHLTQPPSH